MTDQQQNCAVCTCDGANPLLCVAVPCGLEINLLGIEIRIGPICINAEDVATTAEGVDPKAQLEALSGLLAFVASQI